jgi:hypothetical protein
MAALCQVQPMVKVHMFGTGNARHTKLCGHLFQSSFLFRSNDVGLRIRCIGEEGEVGANHVWPAAASEILPLGEFCAKAQV